MKIDKVTFKNKQAWLVIRDENGEYFGTWHIVNLAFVEALRKEMPTKLKFEREGKIGLTIDRETWKELSKLRLDKDFKTLDVVIKFLLKKHGKK